MDVDFGMWGVVKKIAVGVAVTAIRGALGIWYIPVLRQSTALQKEIDLKREALRQQQEVQQRYMDEILAMRTDREAVERAVRQKLNLAKPDEIIYHFEPNKTDAK